MLYLKPRTDFRRASTTTIVRFPYLNTLQDKTDFLYATSNVGILSTSEIGIGIMTSAAATLRPLFVRFLGRSQVGSQSIELSRPWPRCTARAGYFRSREDHPGSTDIEQIGVTTVTTVETHSIKGQGNTTPGVEVLLPVKYTPKNVSKWHTSQLEDGSSEEYRLVQGVGFKQYG